jgi:hypothetical protein
MSGITLNQGDIDFVQSRGMTAHLIHQQLRLFEKPLYYIELTRACRIGDGIQKIAAAEISHCLEAHHQAAEAGRFQKFVPASGAASRMFKDLLQAYHQNRSGCLENACPAKFDLDSETGNQCFLNHLKQFAFYEDLCETFSRYGEDLGESIRANRCHEVLTCLLFQKGLGYARLPKALLKFHSYPPGGRTAFEEHLVEAAAYVKDRFGVCRCHFTISPEHEEKFSRLLKDIRPYYEARYDCDLHVIFSFQKSRTDTIAVDLENQPFRENNGQILFRPGGHGALIVNLNDLQGDLVYIKNIDNVVPERLQESTILWKRILGGHLVRMQNKVHKYLRRLVYGPEDQSLIAEIKDFARNSLFLNLPEELDYLALEQQKDYLISTLNRPLRVCGVVKNSGEPGGGPFWVKGSDGTISLQIVESVQIDAHSTRQQNLWRTSTHFNPVDLVCAVRDFRGTQFDLTNYVDQQAVFISKKSKDGRELKALELPGLWNGGMSAWITVFLEVPTATFNPTKTIWDLLRPEHRA